MTDSRILVEQADNYLEKGDFEEAYRLLLEAVLHDGDGEALSILGSMYFHGDGVREDFDKSCKYFALAYENGSISNAWHLIMAANHYRKLAKEGDGDMTLVMKCYQLAGDMGETYGYECLGDYYLNVGDYEKAYEYLMKPEKYNTTGLYCLGKMYEEGLFVGKDIEKAIEYYQKAIDTDIDYEADYGHDEYCDMSKERLCKLNQG